METIPAHGIQGRENTLTLRYSEEASAASGSLPAHPDAEPDSKEIWSQEKTDLQRAIAETGAFRIPGLLSLSYTRWTPLSLTAILV
jgi:hypothetical protein